MKKQTKAVEWKLTSDEMQELKLMQVSREARKRILKDLEALYEEEVTLSQLFWDRVCQRLGLLEGFLEKNILVANSHTGEIKQKERL